MPLHVPAQVMCTDKEREREREEGGGIEWEAEDEGGSDERRKSAHTRA